MVRVRVRVRAMVSVKVRVSLILTLNPAQFPTFPFFPPSSFRDPKCVALDFFVLFFFF